MDELLFTRTVITNIHNKLVWSDEYTRAIRFHHRQREFSINTRMWARILGDDLTGPHNFPPCIGGRDNFNFLRTT
jgi:hypothetical protein